MNTRNLIAAVVMVAGFSGCASNKLSPPDDLKIVLPNNSTIWKAEGTQPDRLVWDGSATADPSKTVYGGLGPVKAYPMARTRTADGGVREASPYYRFESQPRWWLDAPGEARVILGPTAGDRPASLHPAVIEDELANQVALGRDALASNNEATARMTAATRNLIAETRALREEARQKDELIERQQAEIRQRDARIQKVERENAKLKDAPASYQGDSAK